MQTPEQALRWLEPGHNGSVELSDEAVVNLAAVKSADAGGDHQLLQKVKDAVSIIAEHRQSEWLRSWVLTGIAPAASDTDQLASASAFFGLDNRTYVPSVEELGMALQTSLEDRPERVEEAQKHYKVLLQYFHSNDSGGTVNYELPVGLDNMGNTCYLNCMLQYFFAIKPFRDLIENYNQYKQELPVASLGRAGGLVVSAEQVQKAQECKYRRPT